eukprot:scaffold2707_cov417-Prasinococcus_capsulatus_cf.AAC.30
MPSSLLQRAGNRKGMNVRCEPPAPWLAQRTGDRPPPARSRSRSRSRLRLRRNVARRVLARLAAVAESASWRERPRSKTALLAGGTVGPTRAETGSAVRTAGDGSKMTTRVTCAGAVRQWPGLDTSRQRERRRCRQSQRRPVRKVVRPQAPPGLLWRSLALASRTCTARCGGQAHWTSRLPRSLGTHA